MSVNDDGSGASKSARWPRGESSSQSHGAVALKGVEDGVATEVADEVPCEKVESKSTTECGRDVSS